MIYSALAQAASVLLGLSATALADSSFPTIDVVGNHFFYSNNGSEFFIRGVAYQADVSGQENDSFVDPLADESTCERDVPYLAKLNTNVIRVYALNAKKDHSGCLNLLKENDIYVIADLAEPTLSIDSNDPEWNLELYDRYTSVIDEFQQYDNVLGFFAGNEVVTNKTNSDSAAFVKAAIRDMRAYMKDQGYRAIPVGYSANDDSKTRVASADYFACGDSDVRADFYGINMYEWCGSSSFASSGYESRTEEFSNLTIPVFFSEYGCNTIQPRKFTEVATIFSSEMTGVWSGGIVYMYYQEANDYGLVSVDGNTVSTLSDFNYYSSEINKVSPTSISESAASASSKTMSCPARNANWSANPSLPPTPKEAICNCMAEANSCVVDSSVSSEDYADLYSVVCGLVDCSGIDADGNTGKYGSYSFCDDKDKLDFVLNLYYEAQSKESSACDFSGSASLRTGSTASSCTSILSQAGSSGLGTVTGSVAANSKSAASTDDSSADSSAASSDSSTSTASASSKAGANTVAPSAYGFSITMSLGALLSFLFL